MTIMSALYKVTMLGAFLLVLGCEASDLRQSIAERMRGGRYKKEIVGPEYEVNPELAKGMVQDENGRYVYDGKEPCADCPKSKRIDLFMPILANSTFNCRQNPPEMVFKDKCATGPAAGNCGQIYGPPATRNITVLIPPGFDDTNPAPFVLDLEGVQNFHLPEEMATIAVGDNQTMDANDLYTATMDHFVSPEKKKGRLPRYIHVAIGTAGPGSLAALLGGADNCGGGDGTAREVELAANSPRFANFLLNELMPFVTDELRAKGYPNFRFTDDKSGRAIMGQSRGGAAALAAVHYKPESFGVGILISPAMFFMNLTMSLSWVYKEHPNGMADFWVRPQEGQDLIVNDPSTIRNRFWISLAEHDAGSPNATESCPNYPSEGPPTKYNDLTIAVPETIDRLVSKGHEVFFLYAKGACHTDSKITANQLPNMLMWAFSKWKGKW